MARPLMGATAAATLPAAFAAAVLVSAPYAGTKTAPISHQVRTHHQHAHHADRSLHARHHHLPLRP